MKPFNDQSNFAGAGAYRDIITLLEPIYNSPKDEVIGYIPLIIPGSTLPEGQVWANVDPALIPPVHNLPVQIEAGREVTIAATLIRVRFLPGVTLTTVHRVRRESTTYNIRNVADVGNQRRELHLTCRVIL